MTLPIERLWSSNASRHTKTPRWARRFASNGAGEETRTPDPRITNALLYQLSYSGKGAQV